jgi:hypothetical protein
MFGTIRKHQTWLWVVIITLTIISFVIFFSPYQRMDADGGGAGGLGSINGKKITRQAFFEAQREMNLHSLFTTGRWLDDDRRGQRTDVEREVYQWLLVVQKQEELGIHVGDDAAAQAAQVMMQRLGIPSTKVLSERVLKEKGMTMEDFESYVRHAVGLQELINTVGLAGKLVTPQETKSLYEREHQEVATEAVFFNASNYLASVQVTPEAVAQYYSVRSNNYAIPERVQVKYVKYDVAQFQTQAQAQLTNLNELVEANATRMGTNLFAGAKTAEESKAKLREEILREQARTEARKKALEFANNLFAINPVNSENLARLAQSNNLPVSVTAPFAQDDSPAGLTVGPEFAKAAFSLSSEEPYAGPIVAQDAVYVIAIDKTIPREVPSLDQVRDRVTADFKRNQAREMAWRAATTFQASATNALNSGKSFADVCAQEKVNPVSLPPFSVSTRNLPEVDDLLNLSQLKQAAFTLSPGKVSSVLPTSEGGLVLHLKSKLPIDTAKMQSDLPNYANNLRRVRQQEVFEEWFRKEMEKGLRDTPLARPQQPPPAADAAKS